MSNKKMMTQNRLDRSPIHLLHRVEQFAGDVFHEEMMDAGLTPRQYAVLLTVSQNEGLSQTSLVDKTGIDRSTLADIIRRMLKKGLLRRKRTREDARAYAVRLTPKGKEALSAAIPAAVNADERILNALPVAEREEFLKSLLSITEAIRKLSEQGQSQG
jgi:DNA-binding MarR family transcriptional regulator